LRKKNSSVVILGKLWRQRDRPIGDVGDLSHFFDVSFDFFEKKKLLMAILSFFFKRPKRLERPKRLKQSQRICGVLWNFVSVV